MRNWIASWVASALALFILTQIHIGISAKDPVTLIVAVVVLALVNTFIRPIIMFFAWPVNCLTFGLFGFVINALLFWIVGSSLVPGFVVAGFIPALIGSLGMGFLSGLFSFILKDRGDRD